MWAMCPPVSSTAALTQRNLAIQPTQTSTSRLAYLARASNPSMVAPLQVRSTSILRPTCHSKTFAASSPRPPDRHRRRWRMWLCCRQGRHTRSPRWTLCRWQPLCLPSLHTPMRLPHHGVSLWENWISLSQTATPQLPFLAASCRPSLPVSTPQCSAAGARTRIGASSLPGGLLMSSSYRPHQSPCRAPYRVEVWMVVQRSPSSPLLTAASLSQSCNLGWQTLMRLASALPLACRLRPSTSSCLVELRRRRPRRLLPAEDPQWSRLSSPSLA